MLKRTLKRLGSWLRGDSVRRVVRTFVITTLGLWVPGLLGWLNALTEWARGQGSTPFPDAHGLAYLGVSAITAGVVAVLNAIWNAGEDLTGVGLLRKPSTALREDASTTKAPAPRRRAPRRIR